MGGSLLETMVSLTMYLTKVLRVPIHSPIQFKECVKDETLLTVSETTLAGR